MRVRSSGPQSFVVEFDGADDLMEEYRANLSSGGLRIVTAEPPALYSTVSLTLLCAGGGASAVRATVVAPLPDGVAVAIEGDPEAILRELLPVQPEPAPEPEVEGCESEPEAEADSAERRSTWERIRGLTQVEKILLASKADRSERALLLQDNDARVLLSILKNPRLTIEEVVRIAKSSFLNYQVVDVIMATGAWMNNLDVRVALIRNPKTPPPFALRILPTLPEAEVRTLARGATASMALKQAAIRMLQKVR